MNKIRQKVCKKSDNTDEKMFIIIFSYTVIKPNTMVIEPRDTSVTSETVFAFFVAVTVAKRTVSQKFHVFKNGIEMTDVGLVKVNDFVSGVRKSRKDGKCEGNDSCQCMDSSKDEELILGCETEMIGDDLAQDD